METLKTLALILTPMFVGFYIRLPKSYMPLLDRLLAWLIYLILLVIGIDLAKEEHLLAQIDGIILNAAVLFVLLMVCNIGALYWFDRRFPPAAHAQAKPQRQKIHWEEGAKQIGVLIIGVAIGKLLPENLQPPHSMSTAVLMAMIFLVGMQLRGNGIPLRQVLLNKRGMQISAIFAASCLLAGAIYAAVMPDVPLSKGLALSSGYGWYSLSGIMMTHAYGATWGSITLLNDLLRELFALAFIPMVMRRTPSGGIATGGAASLDFMLPVIQSAGGIAVMPLAISFGFIANVLSPIFMALFSSM